MTTTTSRQGLLKRRSLLKLGAVGAGAATAVGAAPPICFECACLLGRHPHFRRLLAPGAAA